MENLLVRTGGTCMTTAPSHYRRLTTLRLLLSGLCLVSLVSCGDESASADPTSTAGTTSAPSSSTVPTASPTIREVVPYYAADLTDARRLAGLADAVFVGTVSEQSDITVRYGQVNTRFKVKVKLALKGSPAGEVVVEQEGGRDSVKNIIYIVKGDAPLEVGATYVFSAMYRDKENLYSIIPVYGNTRLTAEENKQLSAGTTPKRVADVRDAVAHQILS